MKTFSIAFLCKNHLSLCQDFSRIAFEVGYSYEKDDKYSNLIFIGLLFWNVSFCWSFKTK